MPISLLLPDGPRPITHPARPTDSRQSLAELLLCNDLKSRSANYLMPSFDRQEREQPRQGNPTRLERDHRDHHRVIWFMAGEYSILNVISFLKLFFYFPPSMMDRDIIMQGLNHFFSTPTEKSWRVFASPAVALSFSPQIMSSIYFNNSERQHLELALSDCTEEHYNVFVTCYEAIDRYRPLDSG